MQTCDMAKQLYIITGGPGSGKSSVIDALAKEGVSHMPEAGRAIIQDQVEIGGDALPWVDRVAFANLMLAWEMRSYREASTLHGPVIFDRGIPDVIGYLRLCGLSVPEFMIRAAEIRRYAKRVFIAPYWPEIFSQDAERKQTLAEAQATHDAMTEVYTELGYELVPLPLMPIPDRVSFIRSHVCM
jgi:predicted ATPase